MSSSQLGISSNNERVKQRKFHNEQSRNLSDLSKDEKQLQGLKEFQNSLSEQLQEEEERVISQFLKKEEERKKGLEQLQKNKRKKMQIKTLQQRKTQEQIRKEQLLQKAHSYIKRYKNFHPLKGSSNYFRINEMQKLFTLLITTILQMKQSAQYSQEQKALIDLNSVQLYLKAQKIVNEIDKSFLLNLNEGIEDKIVRTKFQNHWKQLNSNLQEKDNFQKRKLILLDKWKPQEMAIWNESAFFSDKKKQYIRQKERRMLLQAEKVEVKKYETEKEPQISYPVISAIHQHKKRQSIKNYEFLNIETIKFLHLFLQKQKISEMKTYIQSNTSKSARQKLLNNLRQNFQNEMK